MHLVQLRDRTQIEQFLRRDTPLHIYEIGDLDPFFWPATTWYGIQCGRHDLRALALIYTCGDSVTLLAFSRDDREAIDKLIDCIHDKLPGSFYAHLSPGLVHRFSSSWRADRVTEGIKMYLANPKLLAQYDTTDIEKLSPGDSPEAESFYAVSYPGNWFDARMLETGQYFGIRRGIGFACIAGVHVYSPEFKVAALGNIATMPEYRRKGMARRVTARLCQSLLEGVETIGLNVHADNHAAIRCYEILGFEPVCPYVEVQFAKACI